MSQGWVRAIVGIVAFFIALPVGLIIAGPQDLTPDPNTGVPVGFNAIIAVIGVALIVGLIAYAAIEYAQTKKLDSITSQFGTRTIVLMPIAISINIVLGQTVARRAEGADLPRLDRDDPRRRARRADRRRDHRRPREPHLDVRPGRHAVRVARMPGRSRSSPPRSGSSPASSATSAFFRSRPNTAVGKLAVGAIVVAADRRGRRDLRGHAVLLEQRCHVLRRRRGGLDRSRPDLPCSSAGRRARCSSLAVLRRCLPTCSSDATSASPTSSSRGASAGSSRR